MKYIYPLFLLTWLFACSKPQYSKSFFISKQHYDAYPYCINAPKGRMPVYCNNLKGAKSLNIKGLKPEQDEIGRYPADTAILDTMLNLIFNKNKIKYINMLDVSAEEVEYFFEKYLHKFPNTERVEIAARDINKIPEGLSKLKKLQVVDIRSSDSLKYWSNDFGKLSKLKELVIIGNKNFNHYDFLMDNLKNYPKLERIWVKGEYIHNDTQQVFLYKELRKIKGLKNVEVDGIRPYSPSNFECAKELGTGVTPEELESYCPIFYYEQLAKKINYDSLVKVRQK